jgi:hypothetical protein
MRLRSGNCWLRGFVVSVTVITALTLLGLHLHELADEQTAVVTIRNYGGSVHCESILPDGLQKVAWLRDRSCCSRAVSVRLRDRFTSSGEDHTGELLQALRKLRHLRGVIIEGEWRVPPDGVCLDAAIIKAAIPGVPVFESTE